jgi:hypothetical protein
MSSPRRRDARALLLLASQILGFLACAACRRPGERVNETHGGNVADAKRNRTMEPKINRQCDFSQVEETFTTYPCTPVLGRDQENVIQINAPEEVAFIPHGERPLREDTHFIVCGAMQMRTETLGELGMHGNQLEALMLVAVDAKSNKTYSGSIGQLGTPEPMPESLKKPPVPGYLIGESFNPNLVMSFDLPPVETDYFVHAVLGPFKSNVLKVRLRRAK